MDEISMEIEKLLDAVHRSDEYQEYQKQAAQLEADPELKARVMRFRGDNFRLQNHSDKDELFHCGTAQSGVCKSETEPESKCLSRRRACAVQTDAADMQDAGGRDRHTDS